MNKVSLIFGCHAHQPVGNFDFVFAESFEKSYLPFVEVLERFPAVRAVLHFTGPLFDWFEEHQPAFLDRLGVLVKDGQVEIMGGAYYEPLLCAIPARDAAAQIRRMRDYCAARFGSAPRGMWLAERVWEPQMASIMARAGVEYTALDDTHFLCSGLTPDDLFGYHMTEDEGLTVRVFPIQERLRYLVPFHSVEETMEYLRGLSRRGGELCAVLHDDYEKFGVWPGTHGSVYTEGWLERFFQALTDNADWLETTTYADYLDRHPARGRVYLTCASYDEMMGWALPPERQRTLARVRGKLKDYPALARDAALFLRGGFWRGFLARYPEANNLQKRMLRVSNRLERVRAAHPGDARLGEAERLLHQGQCNCAYWHGVFGGLYLNHLRTALYQRLIAADVVLDAVEALPPAGVRGERGDFDGDGNDEAVLENGSAALFFSPTDGGTLFEADYKPKPFNFLNTLSRRDEPYHDLLREGAALVGGEDQGDLSIHEMAKAKETDLNRFLVYDAHRRVSLRDRFLDPSASADTLWAGTAREYGDFAAGRYELEMGDGEVTLTRRGKVSVPGGDPLPFTVRKRVTLAPDASRAGIRYDIEAGGAWPESLLFGVEFAANLLTGSAGDRYYLSEDRDLGGPLLGTRGCEEALAHIAVADDWQRLRCAWRFAAPARVFRFPLDTVSQSEGGQERVHQGCVMVPCWPLVPGAGGRFSLEIQMAFYEE